MAARSDLQNNPSNYGLFRLSPSNTMLKNLFVSSAQSNAHLEDDPIRQRRPSSDSARNMTLLRLDSTGNELNKQIKLEFEKPGKCGPSGFVEAMCGCINVQLIPLAADAKKDYQCIKTCNNYLSRDPDIASVRSLSQFSPTKSTILHDFNRCMEESKPILPKYNAGSMKTNTHENLVSFNRNLSINLNGLAGDLPRDKVGTPSVSENLNMVNDQRIDAIVAPECKIKISEKEVESGEVVFTLEERLGEKQGLSKENDSNVPELMKDPKVVPEMDSGTFSCADDWEDVNDIDTSFSDLDSEIGISDGGLHTCDASVLVKMDGAKKKEKECATESQSSNGSIEPSDLGKEANTDVPRKHCRILPCLLRTASQRYIRGMCFMTRQSSVELDKNKSCLIKALKHVPCKQDLHQLIRIRRRNENSKKRKSIERLKNNVTVESSDSADDDCSEIEDDSDIKSPEKMPEPCMTQASNPRKSTPAPFRSTFYCPLSLSDSSEEEDTFSDDDDTAFSGSSTISSMVPCTTGFLTNFFGNSGSLLWQKEAVTEIKKSGGQQSSVKTSNKSGGQQSLVKTSKGNSLRSCNVDDAEQVAAEQSRQRMLTVNEAWTKIYSGTNADHTNATPSLRPGQCSMVRICKKVHFCAEEATIVPILNSILWADEYASARVGPWVQMGIDHNRFKRRIAEVDAVISKVLTPEHRSKVLLRL